MTSVDREQAILRAVADGHGGTKNNLHAVVGGNKAALLRSIHDLEASGRLVRSARGLSLGSP